MWIGSCSTKRVGKERSDIRVISIDPRQLLPASRISVVCTATLVGEITWVDNNAAPFPNMPPFAILDRGPTLHMFPAPIPVLFNVIPIVSVVIDWDHNYYITINEPHIRFEYTPPPKPNNPTAYPISPTILDHTRSNSNNGRKDAIAPSLHLNFLLIFKICALNQISSK